MGSQRTDWHLRPGARVAERYLIREPIAMTMLSEVYDGEDLETGTRVAFKVLTAENFPEAQRPQLEGRFQREMDIYARIEHPNLVRLLGRGTLETELRQPFMVLEHIDGIALSEVVREQGKMRPRLVKRLMFQTLSALMTGHELNIVHRDVKPGNIMVTRRGRQRDAVLIDYGLAGIKRGLLSLFQRKLTRAGEVPGTAAYVSPEQLRGGRATAQSDIYAWGLVYIECMEGQQVFRSRSTEELMRERFIDRMGLSPRLEAHPLGTFLHKATAREPSDRFKTAREALEALQELDVSRL